MPTVRDTKTGQSIQVSQSMYNAMQSQGSTRYGSSSGGGTFSGGRGSSGSGGSVTVQVYDTKTGQTVTISKSI